MKSLVERGHCRFNELPHARRYPNNKLLHNWIVNPHRGFKVVERDGRRDFNVFDPYDRFYDRILIQTRTHMVFYYTRDLTPEWRSVFAAKLLELRHLARKKAFENQ